MLIVATKETNQPKHEDEGSARLTRVVITSRLVNYKTIWAGTRHRQQAEQAGNVEIHDFFGRRIAVETSFGPGWGAAPLGSAIMIGVDVVKVERGEQRRRCSLRARRRVYQ